MFSWRPWNSFAEHKYQQQMTVRAQRIEYTWVLLGDWIEGWLLVLNIGDKHPFPDNQTTDCCNGAPMFVRFHFPFAPFGPVAMISYTPREFRFDMTSNKSLLNHIYTLMALLSTVKHNAIAFALRNPSLGLGVVGDLHLLQDVFTLLVCGIPHKYIEIILASELSSLVQFPWVKCVVFGVILNVEGKHRWIKLHDVRLPIHRLWYMKHQHKTLTALLTFFRFFERFFIRPSDFNVTLDAVDISNSVETCCASESEAGEI